MKKNTSFSQPTLPTMQPAKPDYRIAGIIAAIIFVLILHQFLGAVSYNFFVITDNLLHASDYIPPFITWALFGALLGVAVGAVTVTFKYKLGIKWMLTPVMAFLIILVVLILTRGSLTNNIVKEAHHNQDGKVFTEVSASSSIPDYNGIHYGADNLTDADISTAWMYIAHESQPVTVCYVFNTDSMKTVSDVRLTAVSVFTGYAKSLEKWKVSAKPQGYVIYKNGKEIGKGDFSNKYGSDTIKITPTMLNYDDTLNIRITPNKKLINNKLNIIAISSMYPIVSFAEIK